MIAPDDARADLYLNYLRAIGHDVGAPLRHIRGFADLLDDELGRELAEEPRKLLSKVQQSAEIAEQMLYGVHELAHLAQGARPSMISSLADLFRAGCRSCERSLTSLEITGDAELVSDQSLLRNAAEQLASNAVLYAVRPELKIDIDINDEQVICCFTDPGPGLTKAEMERAIKPFQRLRRRPSPAHVGLGLTVVHQVAIGLEGALASRQENDGRFSVILKIPRRYPG
ncbi:MAG: HAMP domain-containing sensor histidine kinase [Pseudomonadota bacterium]